MFTMGETKRYDDYINGHFSFNCKAKVQQMSNLEYRLYLQRQRRSRHAFDMILLSKTYCKERNEPSSVFLAQSSEFLQPKEEGEINFMQQNKQALINTKLHYLYVIFAPLQRDKIRSGALTKTLRLWTAGWMLAVFSIFNIACYNLYNRVQRRIFGESYDLQGIQ